MATIRGTLSAVAFGAAAMLLAAGCAVPFGESVDAEPAKAAIDLNPVAEMIKPKVTSVVADGAVGHSPGEPIAVRAADGKLSKVTLLDQSGESVAGAIAPDGQSWVTTQPLTYNGEYRLQADAFGLGGTTTTVTSFTTSSPGNVTKPYVMPGDGDVVGIGQPVAVQFDESIPDRKAAQDAITVVTNPPVPGAFYWVNDREVRWRPENYWAPGTAVTVDVNVFGRNLGGTLFGQANEHREFRIGDSMIAYADDNTKQVTFERNGEVIMTMPTSMGKDSAPTDNGVYIIGDRFEHMVMDSSTYGVPVNSPQGYKTPVDFATRMSYSGIFFHSAPWSLGDQGSVNVSHGCLNLSPANARWVFDNTKRGDLTIVKNTVGGTLSGTDGLGDWNIPWATWKAGNVAI